MFPDGVISCSVFRYKCHLKFSWTIPRIPTIERKAGVVSGFSHNAEITQTFDTGTQTAKVIVLGKHPAGYYACSLIV